VAAEPLGDGRLNFAISGSNFKKTQAVEAVGLPRKGTNVFTGRAAGSFGLNSNMDAFALLSVYRTTSEDLSIGGLVAGGHWVIPTSENIPFKFGLQPYVIYGFKDNKVTANEKKYYAGYDFFDATGESGLGVGVRLTQSLVLGQNGLMKFHFNEGYFKNAGNDMDQGLLLLAMGLQFDPVSFMTIGAELNSRTTVKRPNASDPLWVTPSVMFRTPRNVGLLFGSDITASRKKKENGLSARPLEKYRLFGDMVFSFDTYASKRAEAAEKRRDELNAKAELERQTQELAAQKESLAEKMREDSIRATETAAQMALRAQADSIRAKAVADSLQNLAGSIAQRAHDDSLKMAEALKVQGEEARAQREADSIALAETKKRLDEERARRTQAEQQFLSTGMMTLDNSVQFQSGKTDIPHNARSYLTLTAKMLAKYPKLKIEIGGHSDNIGRVETNMTLSQKRAESVFQFMVGIEPVLTDMLSAKGYGPTVPKADNNSADGRQINRRIELKVLNPEVLQEYNP